MQTQCKKLGWKLAKRLGWEHWFSQLAANSALRRAGWFRSAREGASVNADGDPIPWMTYAMVEFLSARLNPTLSVFEYGSGNSTLWFAKRVRDIRSVEHSEDWARSVHPKLPPNATLVVRSGRAGSYADISFGDVREENAYIATIGETDALYDVVVIDGVFRNACCVHAVKRLAPRGVLVLDNTDFSEFAPGCAFLEEVGFRSLPFTGSAPILPTVSSTSVYYRAENCLGI